MSDENKKMWSGIGVWLFQKTAVVFVLAGALWVQVHYTSKGDFDGYKTEQLKNQAELNKTLTAIALSLKEITDNHAHDEKTMADHETRIREAEKKK